MKLWGPPQTETSSMQQYKILKCYTYLKKKKNISNILADPLKLEDPPKLEGP